jgi:hypothetical protein
MDPHTPESIIPAPSRPIDAGDTPAEQLAAIEDGDTERAPPLEDGDRPTIPPGDDPLDDPEHLEIVRRIEIGLDRRFKDMRNWMTEQLEPLATAARRAADAAVAETTVRSRVDAMYRRCEDIHGPFASVPPNGHK